MRTNATMAPAAGSSSSGGQQDEGGGSGGGGGGGGGGAMVSASGVSTAAPPGSTGHHLVIHRKPPGPWTETETKHLIDAYQEKWYALKRGQLKARHWEEVANSVFLRCGGIEPSKSSVQCRHKIEKLRKRYRTEKQLQQSTPNWSPSKWVFFERMDLLENGPPPLRGPPDSAPNGRQHDSDAADHHHHHHHSHNPAANSGYPRAAAFHHKAVYHSGLPSDDEAAAFLCLRNGGAEVDSGGRASPSPRFAVKRRKPLDDPEMVAQGQGLYQNHSQNHSQNQGLSELASVVRSLGEGFMRIEQMKLEMQRDNERLRMDMEMKRTEMILESQQHIADVIAKALSSKKKAKKMQSPDL